MSSSKNIYTLKIIFYASKIRHFAHCATFQYLDINFWAGNDLPIFEATGIESMMHNNISLAIA